MVACNSVVDGQGVIVLEGIFLAMNRLVSILDKEIDKYLKGKGRYDGYRHRLKAALQLQRNLDAEASMRHRHKALNYVVKNVQKKFRDFTADGGKTKPTVNSNPNLLELCWKKMET